jgi:hypothetical protein
MSLNYLDLTPKTKLKSKINDSIWQVEFLDNLIFNDDMPVMLRLLEGENPDNPESEIGDTWWIYASDKVRKYVLSLGVGNDYMSLDDFELLEE